MILYSERQIGKIREASRITAAVLKAVVMAIRPGATTRELDALARAEFAKRGATSAFLGYVRPGMTPFPASICTSVNDVVIHGLPDDIPLKSGDAVSIDCGGCKDGYIGDTAYTVVIDEERTDLVDERRLINATLQSLWDGISRVKEGVGLDTVAWAIQNRIESVGCGVVREFCGHGVGGTLHEWPNVPNYFDANAQAKGLYAKLRKGMVFTIEPMVTLGCALLKADGWPVKTMSGSKSAHFEHTIAINWDGKVEVLTDWEQKE